MHPVFNDRLVFWRPYRCILLYHKSQVLYPTASVAELTV